MFRPRVIPVLLLKDLGLVKTTRFKDARYVGDPMNAIKIFNDLQADELTFLDITATNENRLPNLDLLRRISEEAFMPFAVGGGIRTLDDVKKMIDTGAEKIVINSASVSNPEVLEKAAALFGSQSVVVCIDVKKNLFGKQMVYVNSGKKSTGINPVIHAQAVQERGAGEIIVNSIDQDGTMAGYDLQLIKKMTEAVSIPVVALGGAGNLTHLREAFIDGHAHAMAAGSMFVFHGPRKAVLINYPSREELEAICLEVS